MFSSPVFPIGELKTDPANPEQMREVFDTTVQIKVPVTSDKSGIYTTEMTSTIPRVQRNVVLHAQIREDSVTIVVEEKVTSK